MGTAEPTVFDSCAEMWAVRHRNMIITPSPIALDTMGLSTRVMNFRSFQEKVVVHQEPGLLHGAAAAKQHLTPKPGPVKSSQVQSNTNT